jgi:hypothetical protein
MEPFCIIVDEETGVGIWENEKGRIEILGRPDMPDNVRKAFQTILSIWKWGLKEDKDEDN